MKKILINKFGSFFSLPNLPSRPLYVQFLMEYNINGKQVEEKRKKLLKVNIYVKLKKLVCFILSKSFYSKRKEGSFKSTQLIEKDKRSNNLKCFTKLQTLSFFMTDVPTVISCHEKLVYFSNKNKYKRIRRPVVFSCTWRCDVIACCLIKLRILYITFHFDNL